MKEGTIYNGLGSRPEAVRRLPDILDTYGQHREMLSPKTLTPEYVQQLASDLTPLTAQGFMRDISQPEAYQAMFEDVAAHIGGCDRLIIYRNRGSGEPTAFLAVSRSSFGYGSENIHLYHLEGIIISEQMQGKGFGRAILNRDLFECQADILAFHTQSKKMVELGRQVSEESPALALAVAPIIRTGNLERVFGYGFMDKGRYGNGPLYGDREKFAPMAFEAKDFDAFSGDAVIYAAYVTEKGKL